MNPVLDFAAGVLRRPRATDAERIAEICQDTAIQRYTRVPIPYSLSDAEKFIEATNKRWDNGQLATLVAEVDGSIVGNVGLVHVDGEDGWGELGYWTAPEARRQGMTTAAVRSVSSWAFEETGLARLELQTAAGNLGSESVARRAGFQQEGVRRSAAVLRATGGLPQERADMKMWGLLPGELAAGG